MGNKDSKFVDKQIKQLLQQYQILQEVLSQNITYLQHKQSGKEYLLRDMTFNDQREFEKTLQLVKKKKVQLEGCQHIVPLSKFLVKAQDQFCSTFFKIYLLFQYPQRTLDDEINERNLHKRKFHEKELWSILASCILGLSHLQKESIKHCSLRSSTILLSSQGIIKVADPFTTASIPNYDVLLNKRSTPHIYLSPEQSESLRQQIIVSNQNPYKADIWTLGMIMLEAGLLQYQDQCYREDGARIHWETLNYNINRFGHNYSEELKNMIELMLSRDERTRPQWIDLEEHVMKVDEDVRGPYTNYNEGTQNNPRRSVVQVRDLNQTSTPPFKQPPQTNTFKTQVFASSPQFIPSSSPYVPNSLRPFQLPHSQLIYNHFIPVSISYIQHTRPLRCIFPVDTYTQRTRIDENLIVVQENQSQEQVLTVPQFQSRNNGQLGPLHINANRSINNPYQESINSFNNQSRYTHSNVTKHQGNIVNQNTAYRASNSGTPLTFTSSQPQYKVQVFKMGSKYEGYQVNGMRHGKGKFYYQDGGMYDGDWNYNRMEGFGKLYYQSGALAYEGQWLKDKFTGHGILYNQAPQVLTKPLNYSNLDQIDECWTKYQGNFLEDNKHGAGKLYFSNGQSFSGEFKNDFANGYGTFNTVNGRLITGIWQNNQLVNQRR